MGTNCEPWITLYATVLSSPEYKCIHVSSGIQLFPGYTMLIPGYTNLGISIKSRVHVFSRVHYQVFTIPYLVKVYTRKQWNSAIFLGTRLFQGTCRGGTLHCARVHVYCKVNFYLAVDSKHDVVITSD